MINFVQNSPHLIKKAHGDYSANCGVMVGPRGGNKMQNAVDLGLRWVMDNDCFNRYSEKELAKIKDPKKLAWIAQNEGRRYDPHVIIKMLKKNRGISGCTFAVTPDIVCDHAGTLLLFRAWLGTFQSFGYPIAFVIQNGATIDSIPFDSIDAIFIGGDNKFKFSDTVKEICREAKRRGKWVHMGRVNTVGRIKDIVSWIDKTLGNLIDSFDGTCYSRFMDTYVPRHLKFYADNYHVPNKQLRMEF